MHFTASVTANLSRISTSARFVICIAICTFIRRTEATFSASSRLLFNTSCELQQQKRQGLHLPCDPCRNGFGVHRPRKNLLSDCWCSCLYMNPLHVHTHTHTHTHIHSHTKHCQRKSIYNRRGEAALLLFSLSFILFISLCPFFKVL